MQTKAICSGPSPFQIDYTGTVSFSAKEYACFRVRVNYEGSCRDPDKTQGCCAMDLGRLEIGAAKSCKREIRQTLVDGMPWGPPSWRDISPTETRLTFAGLGYTQSAPTASPWRASRQSETSLGDSATDGVRICVSLLVEPIAENLCNKRSGCCSADLVRLELEALDTSMLCSTSVHNVTFNGDPRVTSDSLLLSLAVESSVLRSTSVHNVTFNGDPRVASDVRFEDPVESSVLCSTSVHNVTFNGDPRAASDVRFEDSSRPVVTFDSLHTAYALEAKSTLCFSLYGKCNSLSDLCGLVGLCAVSMGRHEDPDSVTSSFSMLLAPAHPLGAVSMGRHEDPNSATSSFSMLLGAAHHLDMKYTLFGKVTKGMEVLHMLESLPTKTEGIFVMPFIRITILGSYWYRSHGPLHLHLAGTKECKADLEDMDSRFNVLSDELQQIRKKCLPN
eukprot:gene27413-4708_t